MNYPKVEELDHPPVVGETYLVKIACHSKFKGDTLMGKIMGSIAGHWYPIFADPHIDPEFLESEKNAPFNFHLEGEHNRLHYHVDYRFLDDCEMLAIGVWSLHPDSPTWPVLTVDLKKSEEVQIKHAPLVCQRNLPSSGLLNDGIDTLQDLYKEQRMECLRCPHQNFNLAQFPIDQDGGIACPMHGLKWSASTGELIHRGIAKEQEQHRQLGLTPDEQLRIQAMLDGIDPDLAVDMHRHSCSD